jgi:hypothetical protein
MVRLWKLFLKDEEEGRGPLSLPQFKTVLDVLASAVRQEKEIVTQNRKEEEKCSLFSDDIIADDIFCRKHKKIPPKLLKLTEKFSKLSVTWYKMNAQKSAVHLYTDNENFTGI